MTSKHFLRFLYNKIGLKPAMEVASAETVQKLEARALQAEKIIELLKAEVSELHKVADSCKFNISTVSEQFAKAKLENEKLKNEVQLWKNKLIDVESKLDIVQIKVSNPVHGAQTKDTSDPPIVKMEEANVSNAAEKKKKEKVKSVKDSKGGASEASDDSAVDVGRLDLRIGKIISVKKHPDADSLYVEEVDVGEEKPRTVVSGLVKFVPIEEMQDRMVVLLCNLKPAKMRGVSSEAMVLCASTPDKVEVLKPPQGALPGDKVHVEGYTNRPDPVLPPKKKIFEAVSVDLKTNNDRLATYKGAPFTVPGKGFVTTNSLVNVNIK